MNKGNNIYDELNSMGSPLADMPRAMPYPVPTGYFEQLAGDTAEIIAGLNTPDNTAEWSKTMPHHVPAGYFEQATNDILAAIHIENTTANLTRELPYSVPGNYFETLHTQVLAAAKAAAQPPIPAKKRMISFKPIRWAAAAALLIGVGIGSYHLVFNRQTTLSANPDKILASIPSEDIQDYLQHAYRMDMARVANTDINNIQVENKDIIEYLNETGWDVVE